MAKSQRLDACPGRRRWRGRGGRPGRGLEHHAEEKRERERERERGTGREKEREREGG